MPDAFPPTVAEREAELFALQSAFDEYIASSRELEEELDAELAKMRECNDDSSINDEALFGFSFFHRFSPLQRKSWLSPQQRMPLSQPS
jgi:hypothetical protein